uniref:Uncharacterized protein ycf35 n=1 Tax=Boldia erythrosiphon TaxID=74908 RepID=A0A1Y9TLM3_9RHOD|nr:conserved hypothetical plastid protein [Boldia erythrosiphon]ARO90502.1 conserved hypothetical plastid protein [Boldia erythrosiphon]
MSHFSKIKTTIRDIKILKMALSDLGLVWKDNTILYNDDSKQQYNIDLAITQTNNKNIGFAWNGFEYELIADYQFWQQPYSIDCFIEKLSQSYAYNSIISEGINQGFTKVYSQLLANGVISVTLQRWLY